MLQRTMEYDSIITLAILGSTKPGLYRTVTRAVDYIVNTRIFIGVFPEMLDLAVSKKPMFMKEHCPLIIKVFPKGHRLMAWQMLRDGSQVLVVRFLSGQMPW